MVSDALEELSSFVFLPSSQELPRGCFPFLPHSLEDELVTVPESKTAMQRVLLKDPGGSFLKYCGINICVSFQSERIYGGNSASEACKIDYLWKLCSNIQPGDMWVIHQALGTDDALSSAVPSLWHVTKGFLRVDSVLIRTNSAKCRDLQYAEDQIMWFFFSEMVLNSLKTLEMHLIFHFKTFSQRAVETKLHYFELEGWFSSSISEWKQKEKFYFS